MAFPQVASITPSTFDNATAHLVAMPATVAVNDLLVCYFSSDGNATVATPSGWSLRSSDATSVCRHSVYVKKADGSEGGTTVDFVTSASESATAQVYRITAASWSGTLTEVAVGTSVFDTNANPDPPGLTPAGGAKDYLWIASWGNDGVTATSAYPANYTDGTNTIGGVQNVATATSRRELNAASENPGTGTLAGVERWQSQTLVVPPSAGAPAVTGTIAVTQGDQTSAITGTVANPITGTIGVTQASDVGAITGTESFTGTVAATQADQTAAITGTVAAAVTGTIGVTQDDQTGAFTGTLGISGTVAATQDNDTMAASGIAAFGVAGTIGVTQGGDTMASSGNVINPITGVLGATQEDDTGAFTGTLIGAITGTLASTQANQTMTATGSVVNLVAGAVVTVTCTIGGPTAACTISPVSVIAGSNFIVTATFRDAMGDLANPTSVTSVVQAPDGTQSTPTPTSSSVGVWTTVVPTDQAGFWFYQISGAGNEIDVVCHGSVCVEPALVLV